MKTIIAGGRDNHDRQVVDDAIKASGFVITEVVSGCAPGVDTSGEMWARANGRGIHRFPANWEKLGKAAGPIRNGQMAAYAEALIAVWDGKSPGTKNMIEQANDKGLKIYVHVVK